MCSVFIEHSDNLTLDSLYMHLQFNEVFSHTGGREGGVKLYNVVLMTDTIVSTCMEEYHSYMYVVSSCIIGIRLRLLGNAAYVACLPLHCQGSKWLSGKCI